MALVVLDIKNRQITGCSNGPMPCQACRMGEDCDKSMAILNLFSTPSPNLPGKLVSICLPWLLAMTAIDLLWLGPSPWIAMLRLPPAIALLIAFLWRKELLPLAGLILSLVGQAAAVAFWSDAAAPPLWLATGACAGVLPAVLIGGILATAGQRSNAQGENSPADLDMPANAEAVPKAVLRINGDAIQVRLATVASGLDRLIYGPDGARARPLLAELTQARTLIAQTTGAPALDSPRPTPPKAPAAAVTPPAPYPPTATRKRLSILLVDEDEVGRTLTRLLLEKMGHEVEETDDAKMALEMALMEGPELALISSRIGRNRGLALAWCIHRGRGPAVYLLRSPTESVAEAQIQRAGLRGVLDKPLTPARLDAALDQFTTVPVPEEAPIAPTELNHELLAEHLTLLGPERLGQIIDSFLSNAPETLAAAATAATDGDVHLLGRAAHKLASGALTVGAVTLATLAKSIDTAAKRHDDATALTQAKMLNATWKQANAALLAFRQRL